MDLVSLPFLFHLLDRLINKFIPAKHPPPSRSPSRARRSGTWSGTSCPGPELRRFGLPAGSAMQRYSGFSFPGNEI
jgi:hypothetical protein